jgi:hypothetical protein
MTLGFAATTWLNGEPLIMVASDTRITAGNTVATDMGVKTYELGGRCAMVAAGAALPPMMAAELTRSVVENHNRRTPEKRANFLDTVRMFSYFLKQVAGGRAAPNDVAVVGFLEGGSPCLARVVVSPDFNRAAFLSGPKGASQLLPVGREDGKALLLRAVDVATKEGRPRFSAAVATLLYIAKHDGAFQSVGGGIAVGTCEGSSEHFSWPIIEIDGKRYMHGVDVSQSYRPSWPEPEPIEYDEDWCVTLDRQVALIAPSMPSPTQARGSLPSIDIDAIDAGTVFAMHNEPPDWANGSISSVQAEPFQ